MTSKWSSVSNVTLPESNVTFHPLTNFSDPTVTPASIYVWFAISISLSIVASILLLLLLLISYHHKRLHTGSRILVVHLLLVHLLICGFTFPTLNITTFREVLPGGLNESPLNCQIFLYIHIATLHAESWATALMAFNRFVAVVLPHYYKKMVSKKSLVVMIGLPWLIGFGIGVPVLFGIGADLAASPPFHVCTTRSNGGVYAVIWVAVGSYSSTALTGFIYGLLYLRLVVDRLNRSNAVAAAPTSSDETNDSSRRVTALRIRNTGARQLALTRMLLMSFLWYALCFLPGPVVMTAYPTLNARYVLLPMWLLRTLVLCGHGASPVIFLALSTDYQTGTMEILRRFWRCTRTETSSQMAETSGRNNSYTVPGRSATAKGTTE